MCNVSDAFACVHLHESGDWGGALADVTPLLQNTSGFSGPQAGPPLKLLAYPGTIKSHPGSRLWWMDA